MSRARRKRRFKKKYKKYALVCTDGFTMHCTCLCTDREIYTYLMERGYIQSHTGMDEAMNSKGVSLLSFYVYFYFLLFSILATLFYSSSCIVSFDTRLTTMYTFFLYIYLNRYNTHVQRKSEYFSPPLCKKKKTFIRSILSDPFFFYFIFCVSIFYFYFV